MVTSVTEVINTGEGGRDRTGKAEVIRGTRVFGAVNRQVNYRCLS